MNRREELILVFTILTVFLVTLIVFPAGGWVKASWAAGVIESKLTAGDAAAYDYFGDSVAISGEVALVGAEYDDDKGPQSGSVYVYRYDGTQWIEVAKLTASDGHAEAYFGFSVAVEGNVAVVGALYDGENGYRSGAAYVFRHDGATWVEEAKLMASDGEQDDMFGYVVCLNGNTLLVTHCRGYDYPYTTGAAYVFRYGGSGWVEEAKLVGSGAKPGDYFGYSASLSGDRVVVGAHRDDSLGYWAGAAYMFHYDGNEWVEETKLTASDTPAGSFFGVSVSLDGDRAIVGAAYDDDRGTWSGSAYVFRNDGTNWVEEAKLIGSEVEAWDLFGHYVSISGDRIVATAYRDDGFTGSAYVFRFDGAGWAEEVKLTASDREPGDYFGWRASISTGTVLIGAPCKDDAGTGSGSAYVYAFDRDEDGVPDFTDNCPNDANPEQENNDGDSMGDACDPDDDNDGVLDIQDACPFEDSTGFDADGDGCIDTFSGFTDVVGTLVVEGVIDQKLQNSLLTKVENSENSADKGNICAAINKLEALKNQTNAQRGNKISNEAADLIIDYADNLITQLLSQLPSGESC